MVWHAVGLPLTTFSTAPQEKKKCPQNAAARRRFEYFSDGDFFSDSIFYLLLYFFLVFTSKWNSTSFRLWSTQVFMSELSQNFSSVKDSKYHFYSNFQSNFIVIFYPFNQTLF